MMHRWWQAFSRESEAFFSWVCESKKELEAFSRTSANLDEQINTVEMLKKGFEEKMDVFSRLQTEFKIVIHFITPKEAGGIKARLTQIGRYREEFKSIVEQREAELHSSLKNTKQFIQDLNKVEGFLNGLQEKLNVLVNCYTSASTTYKTLHEHMDVVQHLQQLGPRLTSLSLGWRSLSDAGQLEKAVADLQQAHNLHTQQATEKQTKLENLLSLWQRYERDLSLLQSWLNRWKSLCSSDSLYLTADNVKLHGQLQMLQYLQSEVPSQESLLESLETRAESLYSSASKERTAELRDLHCNLEERWCSLSTCLPRRIQELQSYLSKLEQLSQVSLALTQWSENFLRHIQSTCKVSITDLQSADSQTKEDNISLQTLGKSLEALQPHLDAFSPSLTSKDLQHLQTRKDDCLQLFSEAQSLVAHQDEALLKLKDFCETYNKARTSLQTFQDAVEGRGSWDESRVKEIYQELGDFAKELARLEVQAISLDIILNKAHFHLQGSEEERTSCRELVDDVVLSVQVLQRSIGTKQSEALAANVEFL